MQINLPNKLTSKNLSIVEGNKGNVGTGFSRPEDVGGWYAHIFKLKKVIDNMTLRGLPIDVERLVEFKEYLVESSKRVRLSIAQHLDRVEVHKGHTFHSYHPSSAGFKVLPADLREAIGDRHIVETTIEIKRKKTLVDGKNKMIPTEVQVPVAKYPCSGDLYQEWFYDLVNEMDYEWRLVDEAGTYVIVKRVEFNPNSRDQLEKYCDVMGYKIPLVTKKTEHGRELKASLDDKAIQKLGRLTSDPIFPLIEEMREIEKLISTYCDGWMPNGEDGRLHSTFMLNSGTGQLRSRNPNVQNAPSHSGEYGKKFKSIVKARPGRVILNLDYTGYHALMLGYFAESPEYMRLSRYGVHDFFAAQMLRSNGQLDEATANHLKNFLEWLSLPDMELSQRLKWIKKNHKHLRDKKAKPITHSIGFGAQANGIYEKNEEAFSSKREVETLRDLYFRTFPMIAKFQDKICKQAYEDRKIVSPYGYVRRFYEAMVYKGGDLERGEQASEAIAFLPANTAFSVKKECMLRLEAMGANEKYGFFNEVHDSMMYEPLEKDVDEAIRVIAGEMTAPVKLLAHERLCPDGLSCDVEISVGDSWASLEEVKI